MLLRQLEKPGTLVSSSDSPLLMSGYVLLEPGKVVEEHETEDGEELIVFVDGTVEIICGTEKETIHAPAIAHIPVRCCITSRTSPRAVSSKCMCMSQPVHKFLRVHVIPNARESSIIKVNEASYEVKVNEVAAGGAANKRLLEILSKHPGGFRNQESLS